MGVVFTLDQFIEKKIPKTVGVYPLAVSMAKKAIEGRPDIYGAIVCGSVLNNKDCSIGSDVDIPVVTTSPDATSYLNELKSRVDTDTHVPLEWGPIPKDKAMRGFHTFDHYYIGYLKFCAQDPENVIGNNISDIIKGTHYSPEQEIGLRLMGHQRKLRGGFSNIITRYDEAHCILLENMMRWTLYDALDTVRYKLNNGRSAENLIDPLINSGKLLAKREWCDMYREEFPDTNHPALFRILKLFEDYRKFIADWGSKRPEDYQAFLDEIHAHHYIALDFMDINIDKLEEMR